MRYFAWKLELNSNIFWVIVKCQSTWCFNRNTISYRMNIIFFSDAGNVTLTCIFSGEDCLCYFWQKGNPTFVTFIHIYKKYHISMYFLRNIIFHLPSKEMMSLSKKEIHLSKDYKKDHIPVQVFWKDHLFRTFDENIFSCIFWRKITFTFPSKE